METSDENYPLLISSDEDDLLRNILTRKAIDTSQQTYDNINESFGSYPLLESSSAELSETKAISNLSDNASFPLLTDSETDNREDNDDILELSNSTDTNEDTCEDDEAEISSIFHHKKTKKKRNPGMLIFLYYF